MRVEILGVPIDAVTRQEAIARAEDMLTEKRGHFLTTPNAEMLVLGQRDPDFRGVLRRADLAIPDSVGLLHAARLRGKRLPERVSGVDFVDDLAAMAARKGATLYLLGGKGDVAQRAAFVLQARHQGLRVADAEGGGRITRLPNGEWDQDAELLGRIQVASPEILFVALGHGKQEKWIADHLRWLPSVRLAIGIGGSFDFIAGDVRRAPAWMRNVGLEWLFRLILQPWRIGRIWDAVVVFPWFALIRKN